jgi:hypothetical protein
MEASLHQVASLLEPLTVPSTINHQPTLVNRLWSAENVTLVISTCLLYCISIRYLCPL